MYIYLFIFIFILIFIIIFMFMFILFTCECPMYVTLSKLLFYSYFCYSGAEDGCSAGKGSQGKSGETVTGRTEDTG